MLVNASRCDEYGDPWHAGVGDDQVAPAAEHEHRFAGLVGKRDGRDQSPLAVRRYVPSGGSS